MKRIAILLFILSLITLGACGSDESQEVEKNEEASEETETETENANENESLNEEELDEEKSPDKEDETLNSAEVYSDDVDKTDEQIEEESGEDFSEDIDNTRDASEIYLETERVMKKAMQDEGHPTVHLSKREYTNMSQPSENTYIVSGKVYTNASELIGSYTLDIAYSDDGGIDYEWKVDYE